MQSETASTLTLKRDKNDMDHYIVLTVNVQELTWSRTTKRRSNRDRSESGSPMFSWRAGGGSRMFRFVSHNADEAAAV